MDQGPQARDLELEKQARWVAGVASLACVTGWAGLAGQPGPRPIPGYWTSQAADPYLSLLSHLYLAWGLPHVSSDSPTWAFSKPLSKNLKLKPRHQSQLGVGTERTCTPGAEVARSPEKASIQRRGDKRRRSAQMGGVGGG